MRRRTALLILVCWSVLAPACGLRVDRSGLENPVDSTLADVNADKIRFEAIDGDSLRDRDGNEYRLIGINAPDRGECLFEEAATRLQEFTNMVGLETENGNELLDQFDRRLVYVFKPPSTPGSERQLINRILVAEGLALAIHTSDETTYTDDLFEAQDNARSENVGLWNPDSCGVGPPVKLEIVEIHSNPPGPDEQSLHDEYVVIANGSQESVDLTGFTVRDESTRNRYSFPSGFELAPGDTVRITSGDGTFGFGTGSPIWNNNGDTVLILDQDGRIVGFSPVTGR